MDLLTLAIGFALGVIVYTIVIYIMVKRIKNKRYKEFIKVQNVKVEGEENDRFIIKENKENSNK